MIEIKNVDFTFPAPGTEKKIFVNSHAVFAGNSINVITGESGCGKTTLLNLIAGFLRPGIGTITVHDMDIGLLDDRRLAEFRNRCIGYIFQDYNLLPHYTVRENIQLPAYFNDFQNEAEVASRTAGLLETMGIASAAGQYPETLSGGERQRVAIARALLLAQRVILADEPTGSLDRKNEKTILRLLRTLQKERSLTIVIATHKELDIPEAAYFVIRNRELVPR